MSGRCGGGSDPGGSPFGDDSSASAAGGDNDASGDDTGGSTPGDANGSAPGDTQSDQDRGGSGAGESGAGGSGGAEPDDPPSSGAYGGYITSGTWGGYAWTATSESGATITPADFASVTDFPLCASGSIEPGNSNVAMVGWNLNQGVAAGESPLEVTPTGMGIDVEVENPGGSELRLQLQGPNGSTDADDRWCAVIPGGGGFIPFDAFNTECWAGGAGTAYAGQPIVAAIVLVPGRAAGAVSFDFCVNKLEEADGDDTPLSTGCALGSDPGEGGGTISGSDTRSVTRSGRQYVVQNNVWNGDSGAQSIRVEGVSFEVTQQGNGASTSGPPSSYPSVFIGSNFGHASTASGLPRRVSELSSIPTGWSWSSAGGTFGAAYDVWFSTGESGDVGTPSGGYLMVWYHDPADIQPLGSPQGTAQVAGRSWQIWICSAQSNGCTQNGVPVISYVPASGTISEWSFDLNDFIRNATDQFGVVQNDWYLTNIFAGFEIWSGGVGLRANDFCAIVN